eukprot:584678-Amphidinium_carterae.1
MGAASFWKDYDAQTRYKHLSGQKERLLLLTDAVIENKRSAHSRMHSGLCNQEMGFVLRGGEEGLLVLQSADY